MPRTLFLLVLLAACGRPKPESAGATPAPPPDREAWWRRATQLASGGERILAPREMRTLLSEGEGYGFGADGAWWQQRKDWVFSRILEMDPDDVQANAGKGYRTLQSIAGFRRTWRRMLEARVTNAEIDRLLELYDGKVQDGLPVFLSAEAFELEQARLEGVRNHLDRLARDPQYEALQVAVARVKGSSLADYPFVHYAAGPFLLFYTARDLQRIEGEDPAAEEQRVAGRRDFYLGQLRQLGSLYAELLADIRSLYPELWKAHAPKPREIYDQWIFGEPGWYQEYLERIDKQQPEHRYRTGFFDAATGWAYLYEPAEVPAREGEAPPPPRQVLRETAAYLAATQLLHRWGRDPKGFTNRLERSRAYWLKEGWPSFLASRRVKQTQVGALLSAARRADTILPLLGDVIERESRLELRLFREAAHEFGEDEDDERPQLRVQQAFTDLAWLVVRHLHEPAHRAAFVRYLQSQIAGRRPEPAWFEECFSVHGEQGWKEFQRRVYASIPD